MPKQEIQILEHGAWVSRTVEVSARRPALESEAAYTRRVGIEISQHFGHEGIGWLPAHGTRSAQADFEALQKVQRVSHTRNIADLLSTLNKPYQRRAHFNKYEKFSKNNH